MNTEDNGYQVLMARQPIFDRDLKVIAYELLYRNDDRDEANFLDDDQATSAVLLNAYTSVCEKGHMKRVPAFLNMSYDLLIQEGLPESLNKQIVIEIIETTKVDDALIHAIKNLRKQGFKIALDDFVYHDRYIPLLKLVQIVKVDVLSLSSEQVAEHVEILTPYGVTLLAEKIETVDKLYECVDLGFKLFQGHFLSKPQIVKGKKVSSNSIAMMHLVQALQSPDITASEIEELIIKDPVLTFKLLKIVNSAAYSLVKKVESLSQAIVMLGNTQIKKWATLIALSSNPEKPEELARTLLARGRMCELLAEALGYINVEGCFMVGLMSEINALLDMEMEVLLDQLPLSDDLKNAIGEHEGLMGELLAAAIAYEQGNWSELEKYPIDVNFYETAYRHSIIWAQDAMAALNDSNAD